MQHSLPLYLLPLMKKKKLSACLSLTSCSPWKGQDNIFFVCVYTLSKEGATKPVGPVLFLEPITEQVVSFLSVIQLFTLNRITSRVSAEVMCVALFTIVFVMTVYDYICVYCFGHSPKSSNMINKTSAALKKSGHKQTQQQSSTMSFCLCTE